MKSVTVMPNPSNTIHMTFCPTVRGEECLSAANRRVKYIPPSPHQPALKIPKAFYFFNITLSLSIVNMLLQV